MKGLKQLSFSVLMTMLSGFGIYLCANLFPNSQVLSWSSMTIHGIILMFYFHILHETVHRTAFASKWLNDTVALLCGLITSRGALHYRYYHYAHHRFTGDSTKDPELANSWIDPNITTFPGYLLYLSGVPFWVDRVLSLSKYCLGQTQHVPYLISPRARGQVCWEARAYCLIYVLIILRSRQLGCVDLVVKYWLLPSLLGGSSYQGYQGYHK